MSQTQKTKDEDFSPGCSSANQKRSDLPEPSCVSMKSDWSIAHPPEFRDAERQKIFSCVSVKSDWSMAHPPEMTDGSQCLRPAVTEPDCKKMKHDESMNQPQNLNESMHLGTSHKIIKFKTNLLKKFECLYEGKAKQGKPTLLKEIYTELYITESETGEVSHEHELRQIETQSRRAEAEDTPIRCSDIFTPLPGQDKAIRTVLTKGVAGIGKTVSVQKFILDWAEGKENQDVQLIFPLPFREINLMKDKTLSLSDLLHAFFPETKELEISSDKYKMMFIFDGLDECRFPINLHTNETLRDVNKEASVDELLMNLIVGNLLPSALIWITSRPAAADLVPSECVHRVTEVRGFTDLQKEEYFRKRISDQSLADRIISHLKSLRSLYIMCHIPVFCWISASVLEKMLSEAETGEIPKTLTQMYTHFLILQTNIKHEKDYEKKVTDKDMILKLGKLAFEQLERGNLIFYEEDLQESGIDVTEASVYSGLCTQIFREEFGLNQMKVFCFVHLSIQEHLAALYVHLSFINDSINAFNQILVKKELNGSDLYQRALDGQYNRKCSKHLRHTSSLSELHERAIIEASKSTNGHLDLFLRFLVGLSVESHQALLRNLKIQISDSFYKNQGTVRNINWIIRSQSLEKSINLFHCLNEMGDHSLIKEIQHYLKSKKIKEIELSFSQWSALAFVLLTSVQEMDRFCLSRYTGPDMTPDDVLLTLLPVVKTTRSAQLDDRNLTNTSFTHLASVISSECSCLRDLDLSGNYLGDYGVELVCAGLKDPHCKLEKLELMCCGITAEGCVALASALRSNPKHLRELNLEWNKVGNGAEHLTDLQRDPHYKLETLRLNDMYVSAEGCAALSSALRSNTSQLNLSECNLQESDMKLLSAVLEHPQCKVKTLELGFCGLTRESCAFLASALRSSPYLRELDLTWNPLGDSGVKMLYAGMKDPNCKLQKLKLKHCAITERSCADLASALRSNPKHLRELDLSQNKLGDSGAIAVFAGLESTHCKLEKLGLSDCGLTDEGCAAGASTLRTNPENLRELDLTGNKIRVNLFYDLKKDPRFKLGLAIARPVAI